MISFNICATIAAYKIKLNLQRYYLTNKLLDVKYRHYDDDHIYVWPPYDLDNHEAGLCNLMHNVNHYIRNIDIDIVYYVKTDVLRKYVYGKADGKVITTALVDPRRVHHELNNARYCLYWHLNETPRAASLFPNHYLIDDNYEFSTATEWLRLVNDLYRSKYKMPTRSVEFPRYPLKTCAVLGSGPSLRYFYSEQDEWDAWIACNFLVCDPILRNSGSPYALCLLDPDAFSPMECMRPLWEGAFELLRKSPAILVTAYRYAPFIELYFPEDVKAKCHYAKTLGSDSFCMSTKFDLRNLKVTPYGNVLTDLMLPVATSISSKVMLYGCDGSPPEAKGNFPKSDRYANYDKQFACESGDKYSDKFYKTNIDKHSLYSRYVVMECLRQGVEINLRCPSWNVGLQCIPISNR